VSNTEAKLSRRLRILVHVAMVTTGAALTRFLLAMNAPARPAVIAGLGTLALAWILYRIAVSDLPSGSWYPWSFGRPLRVDEQIEVAVCVGFGVSWLMFLAPLVRDTESAAIALLVVVPPLLLGAFGMFIVIRARFFSGPED